MLRVSWNEGVLTVPQPNLPCGHVWLRPVLLLLTCRRCLRPRTPTEEVATQAKALRRQIDFVIPIGSDPLWGVATEAGDAEGGEVGRWMAGEGNCAFDLGKAGAARPARWLRHSCVLPPCLLRLSTAACLPACSPSATSTPPRSSAGCCRRATTGPRCARRRPACWAPSGRTPGPRYGLYRHWVLPLLATFAVWWCCMHDVKQAWVLIPLLVWPKLQPAAVLFACDGEEGCENAVIEAGRATSGGRDCMLILEGSRLDSVAGLQVGGQGGRPGPGGWEQAWARRLVQAGCKCGLAPDAAPVGNLAGSPLVLLSVFSPPACRRCWPASCPTRPTASWCSIALTRWVREVGLQNTTHSMPAAGRTSEGA